MQPQIGVRERGRNQLRGLNREHSRMSRCSRNKCYFLSFREGNLHASLSVVELQDLYIPRASTCPPPYHFKIETVVILVRNRDSRDVFPVVNAFTATCCFTVPLREHISAVDRASPDRFDILRSPPLS